MPKKTSRSARALQAQRTSLPGERKNTARPLMDIGNSRLAAQAPASEELGQMDAVFEAMPEPVSALNGNGNAVKTAPRPLSETRSSLPVNGSNSIRPATPIRRTVTARRASTVVNRAPAISREEEYAYIRTDLLTVLLLTILMVAALVVLTILIGR